MPARLGLVVIGGEGAIVLGGVACGGLAAHLGVLPAGLAMLVLAPAAALAGGIWIGAVGALRHWRGVNETIASLLDGLYRHRADEPSGRRPAARPGQPEQALDRCRWPTPCASATCPAGTCNGASLSRAGCCLLAWVLIERTTWGFAARIAGGNIRAAQVQGLPVGKLIIGFTALGGAFAGLAGYYEVSAVHGSANASLAAGYGYTGILIAFLARHNPLAIIPVAILLAGFEASSGLVQRRMDLPDATMLVLQGFVFIAILISETFAGRLDLAALLNREARS